MQRRQRILFLLFGVLAAVLFVVDLSVGAVPIPIREVLAALTGSGNDPVTTKIILNIRLLKAVVALLAGAALAVSGLQMQTLFRNPLAGPYVLGIRLRREPRRSDLPAGRSASGPHGTPANLHPRHCGRCLDRLGADPDADRCGQPPNQRHHGHSHPGHDVFVGCRSRRADPAIPEQRSRPQIFRRLDDGIARRRYARTGSVCCFLPSFSDSCWPSRSSNL